MRVGQLGVIGGLVLSEAERSLQPGLNIPKARQLLIVAESHYLDGYLKTLKETDDGG